MLASSACTLHHCWDSLPSVHLISPLLHELMLTILSSHVVLRRIAIDLNLLSHLYEFLAGSYVLARRKFNLDMVTLPRGWFVLLLQYTKVREASTILLDQLLESLAQLLRDLVYGGDGGRK